MKKPPQTWPLNPKALNPKKPCGSLSALEASRSLTMLTKPRAAAKQRGDLCCLGNFGSWKGSLKGSIRDLHGRVLGYLEDHGT